MKYVVILGDGMADYPIKELGDKTPLEVAKKDTIDELAKKGICGMVKTVPDGMKPGSDVANLSAMGYDPLKCYTGRSPLEAVSIGINMKDDDVALRCNLVTLSDEKDIKERTMVDYSAGEISTEEAAELIKAVNKELSTDELEFFAGISYRHCLIWHGGKINLELTPPHDISDKKVTDYLPKNEMIYSLMEKSRDILENHPVNVARKAKGLKPANSIWLWGEGTKPAVENFENKTGLKGAVISAVDLIKGIGISADMEVIEVLGATGNIDTNFRGKGEAGLKALIDGNDFVYIHIEAPDECGHRGEIDNKVKAIELIDSEIVKVVKEGLEKLGEDFKIMVLPDHPTPIALKTHTSDKVPFIIYDSRKNINNINNTVQSYTENNAAKSNFEFDKGYELMNYFLNNN